MTALLLAPQLDLPDPVHTPEVAWSALLPLLCLSVGAVLLVLVSSLLKRWMFTGFYAWFAALSGLAGLGCTVYLWRRVHDEGPSSVLAGAVGLDGFSVFVTGVICVSVVLAALLSDAYLRREDMEGPEFYVLMLLSAAGGVTMASANDLIVVFLGLEVLSIAAYVLTAMQRRRATSQEAGMKYFVLGAFSSAFFLYGIAFVYGGTGTTNLVKISAFLADNVILSDGILVVGLALLLVGFGFKIAAVPFHTWSPDVYQGSPTPAVAYMAAAVKAAAFAALVRVFVVTFGPYAVDWQPMVYALAVLSLVVGSVVAAVQTDVKRLMAYSSINHAGFILLGVEAASALGTQAVLFYIAAYAVMIAGSFGVIALVAGDGDRRTSIDDYRGLSRSRPVLAFAFTVLLLAQAGVPLTSGFFAKFSVIEAAVDANSYWLALIAMVTAVISAFVYLRVVVAMYMAEDPDAEAPETGPKVRVPFAAGLALTLAVGITIVVGILPWLISDLAADAVPVLVATG